MTQPIDVRPYLHALFKEQSDGLRFGEVLGFTEVLCSATPSEITQSLDLEVMAGTIQFRFAPELGDRSGLTFWKAEQAEPSVLPGSAVGALSALVKDLAERTDNRGDSNTIAEVRQLFERHQSMYGVDDVSQAIYEGIRRKLFYFVSRDTNHYLTLTLASFAKYTVFGLDVQSKQALCFHANAGDPDTAVQLAKAWFTKSAPVLHGVTVGHAKPEAIPGQKPFQIIEL